MVPRRQDRPEFMHPHSGWHDGRVLGPSRPGGRLLCLRTRRRCPQRRGRSHAGGRSCPCPFSGSQKMKLKLIVALGASLILAPVASAESPVSSELKNPAGDI